MWKRINVPTYVYFIIAVVVIVVLFPRDGKFRYSFEEGKPWRYGLLTAPFDFPVYKPAAQLKQEQDSVASTFIPFFLQNADEYARRQKQFDEDYRHYSKEHWNADYKRYVDKTLKDIYVLGIVSAGDYQFLRSNHYAVFKVLQGDNRTLLHSVNDVFTVKSAYSYLLDNCPKNLNANVLRSVDLNNYLRENLVYDEAFSAKVKEDDLQQISLSSGMLQTGEKIVDRGEIIDSKTYNILRSLKQIQDQAEGRVQRQTGLVAGSIVLVAILMGCLWCYLAFFRQKIYTVRKDVIFLLSISSIFVILTELCLRSGFINVYIIPYAIIPIVIRTFFESRTAQITHWVTVLICSLMLPFALEFILIQFFVCSVALFVLRDLTKRSELIKCAIYIIAAYLLSYIGFQFFEGEEIKDINWNILIFFGINFLFILFTYSFIYIIEKIFGYISNVTLVELSDISLPALVELSEKCPGTFQHSLQVSMLGTAAAAKVNANPQLVRTGALYHDLGKLENPAYFTENTLEGKNPHDKLTYEQSAGIITEHVPAGVKIAQSFDLPPAITKFILTHHGTGKAKYFYNSFKNAYPDAPVNEKAFTYTGFNPDTRETAILMMADAVEAASRSLKDYNEESIRQLVNRIIDGQIAEGLLDNAPLTFKNITTIKEVFTEKLLSVYHSRINYPELTHEEN